MQHSGAATDLRRTVPALFRKYVHTDDVVEAQRCGIDTRHPGDAATELLVTYLSNKLFNPGLHAGFDVHQHQISARIAISTDRPGAGHSTATQALRGFGTASRR